MGGGVRGSWRPHLRWGHFSEDPGVSLSQPGEGDRVRRELGLFKMTPREYWRGPYDFIRATAQGHYELGDPGALDLTFQASG